MNYSPYFVITGIRINGNPVYRTKNRARLHGWSTDPMDAKKYLSRKTAEGALNSKFVTLCSVGIKNIGVEEILINDKSLRNA